MRAGVEQSLPGAVVETRISATLPAAVLATLSADEALARVQALIGEAWQ